MASSSASSNPTGRQEGFLSKSSSAAQAPKLGNFGRLYNPFRIMSGHDPGPEHDAPRLGNMKKRYTKQPTTGSPVSLSIREVRQQVAARIKEVERKLLVKSVLHDSSSEDDTVAVRDDISAAGLSLASTPATTPDVSPISSKDDHHDVSDLESGTDKAARVGYGHKVQSSPLPVSPLTPLTSKHMLPPGTVLDKLDRIRQTGARGEILPLFSEMQRMKRAHISKIIDTPRVSSAATDVFLPWDAKGVYHPGLGPLVSLDSLLPTGQPYQFGPGLDFISRTAIEPLYRLDRISQLKVIRAILAKTFDEDDLLRKHFFTSTKATQPVHIFVDASNIIIGFYGRIKQARYIPVESRIRTPSFFFEGFATAIERGRPCAKRIFAGSMKAGSSTPDYMREAASLGYEMNILQRVKGSKKTRSQYDMNLPGVYIPDSHDNTHREQAVDEILQLKMMHTLIDTTLPGTMVVATGDAAEAEFSDGFHKCVLRALQHGWLVEVVGFRENMSSAWFAADFQKHWALQFRIFTLDHLVEELLTPYHS